MKIEGLPNIDARMLAARASGPTTGFNLGAAARSSKGVEQEVRGAAEQLVSSTLLKPLLGLMRQDPLRSDLFHGGFAEDAFRDQLDTILADRITTRSRLGLVDAIYERIMSQVNHDEPKAMVDQHG